MRIEDALDQVRAMQDQVARTRQYYCYRWATVACSSLLAFLAAWIQPQWVAAANHHLDQYLWLWISVACASGALIGWEMSVRWLRFKSDHARRQTLLALQQFAPCLVAGAVVTWIIATFCVEHAVLLPGLWAVMFSQGIFSSVKHLPRGGAAVAAYYLMSGAICLAHSHGDQALAPWMMAVTFGVGQLLTAYILFGQGSERDERS